MELTKEQLIQIGARMRDIDTYAFSKMFAYRILEDESRGREIVQFIEQITGQKIKNNKIENINPEY